VEVERIGFSSKPTEAGKGLTGILYKFVINRWSISSISTSNRSL